jgi:hypothetical protein
MLPKPRRAMMRKVALLLGALLALTDCAAKTVYLRTDGQDVASNPALSRQLELDHATCASEPGDDQDCMALKGYVSVPKAQAAAKQQQLAAMAAERAANEAALVLPPPSVTPGKTAAAKKRKSKPPESSLRSSQD